MTSQNPIQLQIQIQRSKTQSQPQSQSTEAVREWLARTTISDLQFIELHKNHVDSVRQLLNKCSIRNEDFDEYFSSPLRSFVFYTALKWVID